MTTWRPALSAENFVASIIASLREANCQSTQGRMQRRFRNSRRSCVPAIACRIASLIAISVAVLAILAVIADMLDRDHVLVLGGVEHDDALGRAAGDPDALDRATDQLSLVGHQHDLVALLDRE